MQKVEVLEFHMDLNENLNLKQVEFWKSVPQHTL